MKHYPYKVAYKAIFTVVGLVFAFFGTAAVLCVTYFVAAGFYSQKEWDYFKSGSLSRLNYLNASEIAHTYYPNLYRYRMLEEERKALTEGSGSADRVSAELDQLYPKIHQDQVRLSPENTNLRFSIIVGDSNIFESTYQGEDYGSFETYSFTINNEDLGQQETVQIDMYLMKPLTVADSYYQDSWSYQKLYDIRYLVIVQGVLSWVGMVAVMVYMICAAGHVEIEGRDTIVQNGFHLIPFDLLTLLLVGLANLMAYIRSHYSSSLMDFFHLVRGSQVFNYYALSISIMGMLDFGLIMFWSMSLAIRAKRHNLWEQMLLVRQLGWMKDQIKSIWQHLSIIRKGLIWTIVLTAVSITVGVFLSRPDLTWAIVLLCLADALTALILINRYQIARRRLGNQIHQMAEGNIEQHIDETTFSGELAREAQDLNRISDVVKTAVDERTRSDRLKTELPGIGELCQIFQRLNDVFFRDPTGADDICDDGIESFLISKEFLCAQVAIAHDDVASFDDIEGDIIWEDSEVFNMMNGEQVKKGEQIFPRLDVEKELAELTKIAVEEAAKKAAGAVQDPVEKAIAESVPLKLKDEIVYGDFDKMDFRVGTILKAEKHPNADKLLVFQVKMGTEVRQVISGVADSFTPEEMVGKKVVVVANLKPRMLRGLESHGMLLFAGDDGRNFVVTTDAPDGEIVS